MSRKNTVSMPAVPAPSGRSALLIAARMPSIAMAFASMPPSDSSAMTRSTSSGMVAMKKSGASDVCATAVGATETNSGQVNIASPARLATTSTERAARD